MILFLILDPNVSLPMDIIASGFLHGSIPGFVSGGITIASRDRGSGLEFDGGYVDYVMHDGACFHTPDACSAGVTYSMWLWIGVNSSKVLVLDSGSLGRDKAGYSIHWEKQELRVIVKFGQRSKHQYTVKGWIQDRWEHVVWTWHPTKGMEFYLNGCNTDSGAKKGWFSRRRIGNVQPSNTPFVLGANSRTHNAVGNMKLDDMYIWNQVLTEHDVWTFYVNDGVMASIAWRWQLQ